MTLNIANHSSFYGGSHHKSGQINLPVAPKCNVQCNYCNHKFDCLNENRPEVTSEVLSPTQALFYLEQAITRSPNIAVVGITGPGDPFANPNETMETLRKVRAKYPEMPLYVSTNGLDLLPYINELADLQINHVTITINTIDPKIGAEIFSWVRYNNKMYQDINAAKLLIKKQLESLTRLKEAGVTAKVCSTIIPGINDIHVITVASKVAELGADILQCLPFYNTKETLFENLTEPSSEMVQEIQDATSNFIPQMKHYVLSKSAALPEKTVEYRPYIAVCSMVGMMINQHLGEAERFLIYGMNDKGKSLLVSVRKAPQAGGGEQRWKALAETLKDCRTVLVSGVGNSPKKVLNSHGIEVVVLEGVIKEIVYGIFSGMDMQELMKRSQIHSAISHCSGTGKKCG